jgi:hypothetical protein
VAFERRDICGPQRVIVGHSLDEHVQSTYVLYVFDSSRFQITRSGSFGCPLVCILLLAGILQQRAHTSHFVLVTVTCNPLVGFYDNIQALSSVTL